MLDLLGFSFGLEAVCVPSMPKLDSGRGDRTTAGFSFNDKT